MAKILLVEDNEMNRDMLSRRLRAQGLRGRVAVDGAQGVEVPAAESPDLILMDMSLPVLDGWEATRQLKADADDAAHPGHRPDRPRHGRRPREGARGRLRRLRHQAGRVRPVAGEDPDDAEERVKPMTTSTNTLLLVDDNELNRDLLSRRLQRHGFDVVTAVDGTSALELAADREFALVLLDIEMPRVSGLDVLRAIRQQRSASELPVIMVTARQDSADVVEALNSGANDYVTKPVDMPVALARIQAQLARKQAEADLRESEERYALALRGANDGLWDWNLRTSVVFFSERWKQMLGLSNEAVAATPDEWFRRVHRDDVDRLRGDVAAHLEGLAPYLESEHRVLHADGTYRWMLVRGVAVRDATGRAHRMAGSLTDITEGKVRIRLPACRIVCCFSIAWDSRWSGPSARAASRRFSSWISDSVQARER